MNKKLVKYGIAGLAVIVITITAFRLMSGGAQSVELRTEKITRDNISNTVTATGTLEASVTVEVGTQVSGKIDKLFADYNSRVYKGQLIAMLDTETLKSTLESSKATLDLAQAEFEFQKTNYDRNKQLIDKKLISQSDFDQIEYNYKSSMANLNSAKAKYDRDKINLDYAYIYSPIDGIVLERTVEEGETVAASFATPTLFTIANDLTRMEIETAVDEADIGLVKVGQRVEFTVDAFPDQVFNGEVMEIHLMPVKSSSVVTYTIIINAPNPEQILMPGMTADVTFFVTEKVNIVVVPGQALEFSPDPQLLEVFHKTHPEIRITMPDENVMKYDDATEVVWVKTPSSIYPQTIKTGETNELNHELLSGLEEGMEVIVSLTSQSPATTLTKTTSGKSPFMPTPPGSSNKK